MKELKILFVCTGNTCRSPMAEAFVNFKYSNCENLKLRATSAGLFPTEDCINPNSAYALGEEGIKSVYPHNYKNHSPRRINENLIKESDLVVCMNGNASKQLSLLFPEYKDKITSFKNSIGDPYGSDKDAYVICLHEIMHETDNLIKDIISNTK